MWSLAVPSALGTVARAPHCIMLSCYRGLWEGKTFCRKGLMKKIKQSQKRNMVSGSLCPLISFSNVSFSVSFVVRGQRPRRGRWPMASPHRGIFSVFLVFLVFVPVGRASKPAGRVSEPAGRASEPARRAPKRAGLGGGDRRKQRKRKRRKRRKSPYVVMP